MRTVREKCRGKKRRRLTCAHTSGGMTCFVEVEVKVKPQVLDGNGMEQREEMDDAEVEEAFKRASVSSFPSCGNDRLPTCGPLSSVDAADSRADIWKERRPRGRLYANAAAWQAAVDQLEVIPCTLVIASQYRPYACCVHEEVSDVMCHDDKVNLCPQLRASLTGMRRPVFGK